MSDATTDVSCKSCCAKKRETCDGDELSLLWIYGIVVAVFICVALTTCVFCVETRRRRDGITVAQAYSVQNLIPTAHVTAQAAAAESANAQAAGGIEAVAVPARSAAVGVPVPEGYLEPEDEFPEPPPIETAAVAVGDPMQLGGGVSRGPLLS